MLILLFLCFLFVSPHLYADSNQTAFKDTMPTTQAYNYEANVVFHAISFPLSAVQDPFTLKIFKHIDQTFGQEGLHLEQKEVDLIKKTYLYLIFIAKVTKVATDQEYQQYQQDFSKYLQDNNQQLPHIPDEELIASAGWSAVTVTEQDLLLSQVWQSFCKSVIADTYVYFNTVLNIIHNVETQTFNYIPNIETSFYDKDYTDLRTINEITRLKLILEGKTKDFFTQQCPAWRNLPNTDAEDTATKMPETLEQAIIRFRKTPFYVKTHNMKELLGATNSDVVSAQHFVNPPNIPSPLKEQIWCFFMLKEVMTMTFGLMNQHTLEIILDICSETNLSPNFFPYTIQDYPYFDELIAIKSKTEGTHTQSVHPSPPTHKYEDDMFHIYQSRQHTNKTSINTQSNDNKHLTTPRSSKKSDIELQGFFGDLFHSISHAVTHAYHAVAHAVTKAAKAFSHTTVGKALVGFGAKVVKDVEHTAVDAYKSVKHGVEGAALDVAGFTATTVGGDLFHISKAYSWGQQAEHEAVHDLEKSKQEFEQATTDFAKALKDGVVAPTAYLTGSLLKVVFDDKQLGENITNVINTVADKVVDVAAEVANVLTEATGDAYIVALQATTTLSTIIVGTVIEIFSDPEELGDSQYWKDNLGLLKTTLLSLTESLTGLLSAGKELVMGALTALGGIMNSMDTLIVETTRELTFVLGQIAVGVTGGIVSEDDIKEARNSVTNYLNAHRSTIVQAMGIALSIGVDIATAGAGAEADVAIEVAAEAAIETAGEAAAEEAAKEAAKEAAEQALKEATTEEAKKAAQETLKNAEKELAEASMKRKIADEAVQEAQKRAAQKAAFKAAQKEAEEATKKASKKTIKKFLKGGLKESEDAAAKRARYALKDIAKKELQSITEDEAAAKLEKEAADKAIEEAQATIAKESEKRGLSPFKSEAEKAAQKELKEAQKKALDATKKLAKISSEKVVAEDAVKSSSKEFLTEAEQETAKKTMQEELEAAQKAQKEAAQEVEEKAAIAEKKGATQAEKDAAKLAKTNATTAAQKLAQKEAEEKLLQEAIKKSSGKLMSEAEKSAAEQSIKESQENFAKELERKAQKIFAKKQEEFAEKMAQKAGRKSSRLFNPFASSAERASAKLAENAAQESAQAARAATQQAAKDILEASDKEVAEAEERVVKAEKALKEASNKENKAALKNAKSALKEKQFEQLAAKRAVSKAEKQVLKDATKNAEEDVAKAASRKEAAEKAVKEADSAREEARDKLFKALQDGSESDRAEAKQALDQAQDTLKEAQSELDEADSALKEAENTLQTTKDAAWQVTKDAFKDSARYYGKSALKILAEKSMSIALNGAFGAFSLMSGMNADAKNLHTEEQQAAGLRSLWKYINNMKLSSAQTQIESLSEMQAKQKAEVGNRTMGLAFSRNITYNQIDSQAQGLSKLLAMKYISMLTPNQYGMLSANIGTSWGLHTSYLDLYPSEGFSTATTGRSDFPFAQEVAQAPFAALPPSLSSQKTTSPKLTLNKSKEQTKLWFNQKVTALDIYSKEGKVLKPDDPLTVGIDLQILYTLNSGFHTGLYLGGDYHDYTSQEFLANLQEKKSADLDTAHLAKMVVLFREDADSPLYLGIYEHEGITKNKGWIVKQKLPKSMQLTTHHTYHLQTSLSGQSLQVRVWVDDQKDNAFAQTQQVTVSKIKNQRTYGVIASGVAVQWNQIAPQPTLAPNKATRKNLQQPTEIEREKSSKKRIAQITSPTFGSMKLTPLSKQSILFGQYFYQTTDTDIKKINPTSALDYIVFATYENNEVSNIGVSPVPINAKTQAPNVVVSVITGNVYDKKGNIVAHAQNAWEHYSKVYGPFDEKISTYIQSVQKLINKKLSSITFGSFNLDIIDQQALNKGQFIYSCTQTMDIKDAQGKVIPDYLITAELKDNEIGNMIGMPPTSANATGLVSLVTGNVYAKHTTLTPDKPAPSLEDQPELGAYESQFGTIASTSMQKIQSSQAAYRSHLIAMTTAKKSKKPKVAVVSFGSNDSANNIASHVAPSDGLSLNPGGITLGPPSPGTISNLQQTAAHPAGIHLGPPSGGISLSLPTP